MRKMRSEFADLKKMVVLTRSKVDTLTTQVSLNLSLSLSLSPSLSLYVYVTMYTGRYSYFVDFWNGQPNTNNL